MSVMIIAMEEVKPGIQSVAGMGRKGYSKQNSLCWARKTFLRCDLGC